ncbi:MAG TPA: hypothetical protein PK875_07055 [Spirochaetota bacterium]|nr:hypothetical protein [Spirochaetota bacterium]HPI15244.1 hypothetical protein [Spirochaetota bacterium]HPO45540.1 hypothetical protein [Spirochaetota bacterium]
MKPIRLSHIRQSLILPLMLAAFAVSCEVQDFGEILDSADREVRWYSVVQHAGVSLPLEIPADGTFTEPRNASMITIVAVLPEPVDPASISTANIDFIGRDNADAVCDPPFSVSMNAAHTQVRVTVFGLTDIARYRIRLKNNSGVELSQRVFARLMGDVLSGDNRVDATDNAQVLAFITDPEDLNAENALHIRADIDCDLLHHTGDLTTLQSGSPAGYPRTLSATVPDFL